MSFFSRTRCKIAASLFLSLFSLNCGSIKQTAAPVNPATAVPEDSSRVLMFATDYQSPGVIYSAGFADDIPFLNNENISGLGTSAQLRVFSDKALLIHDGFSTYSNDNVQILDAGTLETISQFSTGNGTNPHDAALVNENIYSTLYYPEGDPQNIDDTGNPAHLIKIDAATGDISKRISFQNFLTEDGDKHGNADTLLVVGNHLLVILQDLAGNTFRPTTSGKVGIVNITTDTVEAVFPTRGKNPMSTARDENHTLFLAHMAPYDFVSGNFDTTTDGGGLEAMNWQTGEILDFISDEDLGGYVERVRYGDGLVFAVVSNFSAETFSFSSRVIAYSWDGLQFGDALTIDNSGDDIREILYENGRLWISRRVINAQTGLSDPKIEILNIHSDEVTELSTTPLAPVMSMALFQEES